MFELLNAQNTSVARIILYDLRVADNPGYEVNTQEAVAGVGHGELPPNSSHDVTATLSRTHGVVTATWDGSHVADFSPTLNETITAVQIRIDHYYYTVGFQPFAVDRVQFTGVPEPASAALLGLGTTLMFRRRDAR